MSRGVWACQDDFWTWLLLEYLRFDRLDPVITVFVSYSPLSFLSLPYIVRPVETANLVPALYRQSNQRPTSSKPTSTSCRLSWHVSPNVPALSSPRSTVYRSVAGQVGLQTPQMTTWVFLYDVRNCNNNMMASRSYFQASQNVFVCVYVYLRACLHMYPTCRSW